MSNNAASPASDQPIVMPFEDPSHEWNGSEYHTGKGCIEGCGNPAGTAWSPHWCLECNAKRMRRITKSLAEINDSFMAK